MKTPNLTSFMASRPLFAKTAGYSLFFITALAALIYIRFPVDAVGKVIQRASLEAPVEVRIGSVSLSFPPGLAFHNVVLSDRSSANNHLLNIERLKARPSILSALTGNRRALLSAKFLEGDVEAVVDISGENNEEINVEFGFSGINTGAGQWWDMVKWGSLKANVSGEGSFSVADPKIIKGEGRLKVSLEKGLLKFKENMGVKLPDIAIDSGELELGFVMGKLTLEKASLSGPEFSAEIRGDVYVNAIPKYSRFNLTVKVSLEKSFEDKLGPLAILLPPKKEGSRSIRIGGSAVKPDLRFE